MRSGLETCENCGRTIGRLEMPNVFEQHVVCATCYSHLKAAKRFASSGADDDTALDVLTEADVVPTPPPMPAQSVAYWSPGAPAPAVVYRSAYAKPKYVDSLATVRLICLLVGLVFWPLLLVWLALGVYHLIMKSRG